MNKKTIVVSFASGDKGGSSKTTNAWNMAWSLISKGYKVGCLDADPNQILTVTNKIREKKGLVGLDVKIPRNTSDVNEFISFGFDYVIIDLAGHDSPGTRHLINLSDHVVYPFLDSASELIGYQKFSIELKKLGYKKVKVLPSRINSQRKNFSEMHRFISSGHGEMLSSMIYLNSEYSNTMKIGRSVYDRTNQSASDCKHSVDQFVKELLGVLNV